MVTVWWDVVNAVEVEGLNVKSEECPAYAYVLVELFEYVLVITKPVGSKYSPSVYVTFVGAVLTEIEDKDGVGVLDDVYETVMLEHEATADELLMILKYLYPDNEYTPFVPEMVVDEGFSEAPAYTVNVPETSFNVSEVRFNESSL